MATGLFAKQNHVGSTPILTSIYFKQERLNTESIRPFLFLSSSEDC